MAQAVYHRLEAARFPARLFPLLQMPHHSLPPMIVCLSRREACSRRTSAGEPVWLSAVSGRITAQTETMASWALGNSDQGLLANGSHTTQLDAREFSMGNDRNDVYSLLRLHSQYQI